MTTATSTTVEPPATGSVMLDAYAARSCAVKTHNAHDRTVSVLPAAPDEALAELFDGGLTYETRVLDAWAAAVPKAVDLRSVPFASPGEAVRACLAAARAGAAVIIGARLPADRDGHRVGNPDALVRGAPLAGGGHRYHPVEVKWHRVIERRVIERRTVEQVHAGQPTPEPGVGSPAVSIPAVSSPAVSRPVVDGPAVNTLMVSTLADPSPDAGRWLVGRGPRVASREGAFLQLAHYHRLLVAAGLATDDDARAAVIGTDVVEDTAGPVLAWVDLDEPLVRTFSRSEATGWRFRSLLERYDHEYAFRLDVARRAQERTGSPDDPPPLVRPIVVAECSRCPWWEHCRPQLDAGDISLRIDKGRLDVREIAALRRHGIETLTDLVGVDLDELLPQYLPEVAHRPGAESRLRTGLKRAEMLLGGIAFERTTTGPIAVPGAALEVDLDLETSVDGRVYLWGFWVQSAGGGSYQEFSRFADLDDHEELALARRALTWLRAVVEGGGGVDGATSVRVYHYSDFEPHRLMALAERTARTEGPDPVLDWAVGYAAQDFVDLLEIVKTHFFGVAGLGLKAIARQAGFTWRDEDPGGLNSQRWFTDAVHADSAAVREQARQRVLDYNEDDVLATAALRSWLRAQ